MASSIPKIVTRVMGEELNRFEADNIIAKQTKKRRMNGQQGFRSQFTEWVDQPKIGRPRTGLNIPDADFEELIRLAVPHRVNRYISHSFTLDATIQLDESELRDEIRAGMQIIDAEINDFIMNLILTQGGQTYVKSAGIDNYSDFANVRALLNRQQVPMMSAKTMFLNPDDSVAVTGNLANRSDSPVGRLAENAYEEAMVANISKFKIFETSYTPELTAAQGGGGITVSGAQSYTPQGFMDSGGEPVNVDNRSMLLNVSSTANVKAGDRFTISNSGTAIREVSMINKKSTGKARVFTVKAVTDSDTLEITPPIVPADGTSYAQQIYANCTTGAANGATITFVNTQNADVNVFWENDSVCINSAPVAGSREIIGGMEISRMTTDMGFDILLANQGSINNLSSKWRLTTHIGGTVRDPLRAGIMIGGQT